MARTSFLGIHPKDMVQMKENAKSRKMFSAALFTIMMMMMIYADTSHRNMPSQKQVSHVVLLLHGSLHSHTV